MLRTLFLLLALLATPSLLAQPLSLTGVRHAGPGLADTSSARFDVTFARAGESVAATDALIGETLALLGTIQAEDAHLGQRADIFVVHRHGNAFSMLDEAGKFRPWTGVITDLVPAQRALELLPRTNLQIFSGRLGVAGTHMLYLGYRVAGADLRYTLIARRIEVLDTSPLDAARALYSSTIAPDILPTCLRCHFSGGTAPGAIHSFVPPSDANHLELNLAQFRLLLQPPRGKDYVLFKVSNMLTHGGNVVVPANGSDYLALERFLNLLSASQPQ